MNALIKRVIMPLGIVAVALAPSCGIGGKSQSPLAGIWYNGGELIEIDPEMEVVRFYEEGIDGLSEVNVRNVRVIDDNHIEFEGTVQTDEYEPVSIVYNPEEKGLEYNCGHDGFRKGIINDKISYIAAPFSNEGTYIFGDTLYSKKIRPYIELEHLKVTGITKDGYTVEVPGEGEGYVKARYFEPVPVPSDLSKLFNEETVFNGKEDASGKWLTDAVIKVKDNDAVMSLASYPADGMGVAAPARYRGGKIEGANIIFDKEALEMDAFDNFDLTQFTEASDTIKVKYFYGLRSGKERLLINGMSYKVMDY